MRKHCYLYLLLIVIMLLLPACDEESANGSQPSIQEESSQGQYEIPPGIQWLATHWDASAEEWIAEAIKASGKDDPNEVYSWLTAHEVYGWEAKDWDLIQTVEDIDISISEDTQPQNEADWTRVGESLIKELLKDLSTDNVQRSFCFRDIKEAQVQVMWSKAMQCWVCMANAQVNYDGILEPQGVVPQGSYYSIPLGIYRIQQNEMTFSLQMLDSDVVL